MARTLAPPHNISKQIRQACSLFSSHFPSPILPLTLGLSLGCLLSAAIPAPVTRLQLIVLFLLLTPLTASALWKNAPNARRLTIRLLALLFATLIGWLWHSPRLPNSSLPTGQDDNSIWTVEIASLPKRTPNNFKYQINTLLFCRSDSTSITWKTKAQLYLNALDSSFYSFNPGDIVLLTAPIVPFKPSDSSSLFDFPTWAHTHGIAGNAFANALSIFPLHVSSDSPRCKALMLHAKIINKMKAAGIGQPELGPIAAMTFGERTELSADLNRHFRNSGLAHILAISGFHVGIIFWLFQLLVKPITIRSSLTAYLRHLTPVAAIWLYAAFCGLAPPIVRAATIVTVYACALTLQVKISHAEAFFISLTAVLLAQPVAPYDIGFYLSFLAVAGIAIFLPFFNEALHFKSKKVQSIANLFYISIAAQLATSPLILLAFRSLPLIGILASAPASLLAFPILFGGFLIAILPEASIAAQIVAVPLKWAGKSLIFVSQTADTLNPPALSNIVLPAHAIILASLAILAFALYALYRKKPLLLSAAAAILAACISARY